MLDKQDKPIVDSPRIYFQNRNNITASYYLQDGIDASGNATFTEMNYAPFVSMWDKKTAPEYSICFGLDEPPIGTPTADTLYQLYYNKFLQRIYNEQGRIVTVQFVLPLGEFLEFRLNDVIYADGQYYIVNNLEYNLSSREAKAELFTFNPSFVERRITGIGIGGAVSFNDGGSATKTDIGAFGLVQGVSGAYWRKLATGRVGIFEGVASPTKLASSSFVPVTTQVPKE